MYEMLAGAPPFEGDTEQDLFNAISYGDVKYPSSLQDDAVDILSKVSILALRSFPSVQYARILVSKGVRGWSR